MFGRHRKSEGHRRGPFMRVLVKLLLLLLVFSAGGITGGFYGLNLAFSKMREHATHIAELPDHAVPRLAEQLSLTDEQLPLFDAAFRRHHSLIVEVEGQNAVAVHQHFYEMGKEILALLDETQAAEFRETHRKICSVFLPPFPINFTVDGKAPVHHCLELQQQDDTVE